MKQKLLNLWLLALMTVLGSSGARAVMTVGNTDYTSEWWTAFSPYYTIRAGQTLHLDFINHTCDNDLCVQKGWGDPIGWKNYFNYILVITNDVDRGAPDYKEYAALRPDNYGWGEKYDAANNRCFWDWTNYQTIMNGASVDLDVIRRGTVVDVRMDVIGGNGYNYFQYYTFDSGDNVSDFRAFLTVEYAYIDIVEPGDKVFSLGDFDYELIDAYPGSLVQLKAMDGTLKGDIVIPDSVTYNGRTYVVSRIEMGNNPDVTSLSIPRTVTSIASLTNLTGLQHIYVDAENTVYQSMDGMLIRKENMRLDEYPRGRRGECVIPEGVRQVNTYFHDGVTKMTIPSTVSSMSNYIGRYVKEFAVAADNETYCSINGALYSKDGRTLIAYPADGSTIASVSSAVDSIAPYAFYDHSQGVMLSSVAPPAIARSSSITGLFVKSDYLSAYQSDERTKAYSLYGYDFEKDSLLYAVKTDGKVELVGGYQHSAKAVIPSTVTDPTGTAYTVTAIGRRCFYQNQRLSAVELPAMLESIGDSAFYYTNLTAVNLPETLQAIGSYAFYNTDLTELHLPASLKTIGRNAFVYCYSLYDVYVQETPVDISAGCFSYYRTLYVPSEFYDQYSAATGWRDFTIVVNDLMENGFTYKKLTDETVSVVKYSGTDKNIVIPDVVTIDGTTYKVTEIANEAFYNKSIQSLVLPQYLTTIGDRAFQYNNSLKEVTLPESLKVIGYQAFYNCSLTSVVIPRSVTSIGSNAFSGTALVLLWWHDVFEIGSSAFGSSYSVRIFVTPASSVSAFKAADVWKDYQFLYGVDGVSDDMGFKKISDTEVAVVSCSRRFDTSGSVRRVDIPEAVTIGGSEYRVTTIADSAFYNSQANYFTIPASIDSIGYRAFYTSNEATIVLADETPARISDDAFYGYYNRTILVPASVVDLYKELAGWMAVKDYIRANGTLIDGIIYKPVDDSRAEVDMVVEMPASGVLFIPKEVSIEDKTYQVAVIGSRAFSSNSPQYLVLPETIDSIGNPNDLGNRSTYLLATTPPKVSRSHTNRYVYVPSSAKADYDADSRWKYAYGSEDYIIGVDGMADSLVYKTVGESEAQIVAWMKAADSGDTITVPASITTAGGQVLTVTGLADRLFYGRNGIRKLILPASISFVGQDALPYNVNTVMLDAIVPPAILSQSSISSSATLWVKGQSVQAYLDAAVWNQFKVRSADDDAPLFSLRALDDEHAEITGVLADGLTTVVIPDSVELNGRLMPVTSIGDGAFSKLTSMQSLVVSASVENFGYKVFPTGSNSLRQIQVRAGNKHFTSRSETADNRLLLTKDGKVLIRAGSNGISTQRSSYYEDGKRIDRMTNSIDGVETLAPGALDGYNPGSSYSYHNSSYLQQCLPLPASLKTISGEDLMNVQNLRNITVDTLNMALCDVDGVLFSKDTTSIIRYPDYRYSYGIRDYELPSTVRRIESLAFYNAQFETLTLSDSLKFIAVSAFFQPNNYYSSRIRSLTLNNDDLAVATELSFTSDMYQNTILYVPMGTQYYYLTVSPWSKFRSINSAVLADEDFQLLKAFYEEMGNGASWYNKWTIGETASTSRITRGIKMKDSHVYSIDLSGNGLEGWLSDKLFSLPKLEVLNLSNNRLTGNIDDVLNAETVSNTTLRELNISYNQLSGNIGVVGTTLKGLTTLNAYGNCLTQVTPVLPSKISTVSLGGQQMGLLDYRAILQADKAEVEAGIPNLLFYDSNSRNFSRSNSYTLYEPAKPWYMSLRNVGTNVSVSAYNSSYKEYKLPSGTDLQLSGGNNSHTATVWFAFDAGDVNFDTAVDVADLQLTVNRAVGETIPQLFNFTAANIVADDWVNVQDVVCLANILIEQDTPEDTGAAASRRLPSDESDPEAVLNWQGNQLVLTTSRDVAAIDLVIDCAGETCWLVSGSDYDFIVRNDGDRTHIVHYSMSGKTIKAGATAIAEVKGGGAAVRTAKLVDKQAQQVSVGLGSRNLTSKFPTEAGDWADGIRLYCRCGRLYVSSSQPVSQFRWSVYALDGTLLAEGSTPQLTAGTHALDYHQEGQRQVVVRLTGDELSLTKKISITK